MGATNKPFKNLKLEQNEEPNFSSSPIFLSLLPVDAFFFVLFSFPLRVALLTSLCWCSLPLHIVLTLLLSSPLHAATFLSFSHCCSQVHIILFLSSLRSYSRYYSPIRVDTISLDLWMSKGAHNVLVLVIIFLDWKPKQVILSLFEDAETTRQALVRNLIDLLDAYGLRNKIITYVKDKSLNLNTLTSALKYVVKYGTSSLEESF